MGVYLGLGSNLGNRRANLRRALCELDASEGTRVTAVSPVYETPPFGPSDQPDYLNVAVEIETILEPLELLNAAKSIESEMGRVPGPRWGPRVLDIDILLWEERVLRDPALRIPHGALRDRVFVLFPLRDIAPDAVDPETGRTVADLARDVVGAPIVNRGPLDKPDDAPVF